MLSSIVTGQGLQEPNSEICSRRFIVCPLDQHLWESAGSRTAQAEKLGCDVVLSQASANPMGSFGAWRALHIGSEFLKGVKFLCS